MAQALTFTADFKLGHYMKIPPRTMFWCQVSARAVASVRLDVLMVVQIICTVIAGTVQLLVQTWMFDNIP